MENQTCLVKEYIVQKPSKIGVTMKGIANIKYAEKIKDIANGAYLMKGLHDSCCWKEEGYKADREVAAFILDHPALEGGEGFGRVPPTGSIQQYILNQEWKRRQEVLIDMRFGNNDRHNGNILNSNTNGGRLIPIDHGECFPTELYLDNIGSSSHSISMLYGRLCEELDVKDDLDILKENGLKLGARSELIYKVQNTVLKEIGNFMKKSIAAKKEKAPTIIDIVNCMSGLPEAWSAEENQLLELVDEKTKSALDYKRSLPEEDLKGSTSTYGSETSHVILFDSLS
ncbi:hypothetical protein Bca4012_056651 [Brassica carinata]|uniref:1-phosphatidylinositol 4-kinase n=1 Tax=Brassica carinata TaxID=52824 RepID=A0A8X7W581_BRACI|nr:hypothetical protein Bca52824_015793 [Brassica carinata]